MLTLSCFYILFRIFDVFQAEMTLFIFHKVSESDCNLGDLDLQGLALEVGEAFVCHVQQRVSEKPAGTRMKHTIVNV